MKKLKYMAIATVTFALLIGLFAPVSAKATKTPFEAVFTYYPGQYMERYWEPDGNIQIRGAEGYAEGTITIGDTEYECEATTVEDVSWNIKVKGEIVTFKGVVRGRMVLEFGGGSFEIRYITIVILESGVLQSHTTNGEGHGAGPYEGQKMKIFDDYTVGPLPGWTWLMTWVGEILSC